MATGKNLLDIVLSYFTPYLGIGKHFRAINRPNFDTTQTAFQQRSLPPLPFTRAKHPIVVPVPICKFDSHRVTFHQIARADPSTLSGRAIKHISPVFFSIFSTTETPRNRAGGFQSLVSVLPLHHASHTSSGDLPSPSTMAAVASRAPATNSPHMGGNNTTSNMNSSPRTTRNSVQLSGMPFDEFPCQTIEQGILIDTASMPLQCLHG